ncbi:MAG: hypothetical protein KAI28_04435 [Sphingomonadales bacterium]|nr:hypothetical protein [Sphingomonadales bacterium]
MKKTLKISTVALMGMALSACVTGGWHDEFRTLDLGHQTVWQDDAEARKLNTVSVRGYSPQIDTDDGEFTLKFKQSYTVYQYGYDAFQNQKRSVKDFDLMPMAVLGCTLDMSPRKCKSRKRGWRDNGEETHLNFGPNGQSEVKYDGEVGGGWNGTVNVTGFDAEGNEMKAKPIKVKASNSQAQFNLKRALERLPKQSVTADVNFVFDSMSGKEVDYTAGVGTDLITNTNLYAEHWLPQNEQKILYMTQIKDAMKAENWNSAWTGFNKLWDLDFEKPISFFYRYGLVLYKAGEPDSARKYLQRYMLEAGENAKYYKQAKEMVGE